MTENKLTILLNQLKNDNIPHTSIDRKFEKLTAREEEKMNGYFRLIALVGILLYVSAFGIYIASQQAAHRKLVLQQLKLEREQIFNNTEYMYSILFTGE